MAAMHLGDLGAEVIKVDPTARRARPRRARLPGVEPQQAAAGAGPDDPADLAVAQRLIADADVVMFDAVPGVLESARP